MINILILTLGRVGEGLLEEASLIMGKPPSDVEVFTANCNQSPEIIRKDLQQQLDSMDQSDGILILADIYGATHVNIACQLLKKNKIELVAGVNLPMLVRVLNYRHKSLPELVELAVNGGKTGVVSKDDNFPGEVSRS